MIAPPPSCSIAGHGFGPVAVMQAAALAVERAKKIGVCFGLVRETTHTGAIGRYAQWIAQQDCAAILVMGAGPTLMAYHGTRVASLSTSPIAIAVPSGNGPIVLDMATSDHRQRQDPAGARHRRTAAAKAPCSPPTASRPPIRRRPKFCCRSAVRRAPGSA